MTDSTQADPVAEPAPPSPPRSGLSAAQRATALQEQRRKKKKNRKVIAGVVLGFFALIIFYGMQPLQGSIRYGICRTFIELQLPYPHTLQVNALEESHMTVRVYYSHIDSFGSSKLNMMECEFRNDPKRGLVLDAARANRNDMGKPTIAAFNATIPFILQNPPSLVIPRLRSDSLADLKIDYY